MYSLATENGCSATPRQPALNLQARDQDPCDHSLPLVESEAWIIGPNLPLCDLSVKSCQVCTWSQIWCLKLLH